MVHTVLTVTPVASAARGSPSRVQTAEGQGSAVTLTDRTIEGSSRWMRGIPRQGSGSTRYEETISGLTARERGRYSRGIQWLGPLKLGHLSKEDTLSIPFLRHFNPRNEDTFSVKWCPD